MKKAFMLIFEVFHILPFILLFNVYNKDKSGMWFVITAVVLLLYSLMLFLRKRKIPFKRNIKLWILMCLWILFFLKLLFNASLQLFLIANIIIQILYFFVDKDETGDGAQSGEGQSGDQSGDGSMIDRPNNQGTVL